MMRCIVSYHEAAQKTMSETSGDNKITWNLIYQELRALHVEITEMKFHLPRQQDDVFQKIFTELNEKILSSFRNLSVKE